MIRQLTIFSILLALTFLNGCTDEDALRNAVQIPVSLYIPADVMETRALPGDPGSYEKFNQPEHLYLYLVFNKQSKTQIYSIERQLDQGWEKIEHINGDSIYRYRGTLNIYMVQDEACLSARVYAAVSSTPLTLNVDCTSEETIKNATFTLTNENNQSLQDIYSTPYNLMETVNNVEQYYGTIKEINTAVPHVNLILYHVAAKVDLIWNVADDKQTDICLTEMKVNGLSSKGYLFRPNENDGTLVGNKTYSHSISINRGNQWDGRAYFYAIPYSNGTNFPLTLNLKAKDKNGNEKTKTAVPLNIPYQNTTDPFTHWMRGNITINGWN